MQFVFAFVDSWIDGAIAVLIVALVVYWVLNNMTSAEVMEQLEPILSHLSVAAAFGFMLSYFKIPSGSLNDPRGDTVVALFKLSGAMSAVYLLYLWHFRWGKAKHDDGEAASNDG
jgi:ABC-type Co2+ transport system permease subunit